MVVVARNESRQVTPPGSRSRLRFAAAWGGAAVAVAVLFAAARALAPCGTGLAATLASVLSGGVAMLVFGSFAEWVVHGILMHSRHPLLRRI